MAVGIEKINAYFGVTRIGIRDLFAERGLDLSRFDNLMMRQKSVGLPCEDAVTNAVNAAKPIIDEMGPERDCIELLITATESGIDFGKSLSTYIHGYLGLSRRCRLFEVKQACYGGTAALQMAASFVAANASPGAKALVIATDSARAALRKTYAEPSQGFGSVAMLVGDRPAVMALDLGASGFCSYEVMDTCRPQADIELGDPDLSLLAYLDCLEGSYLDYAARVADVDVHRTFDYLAFHTPFVGMVKGAHRHLMRRAAGASREEIEADFARRVAPSLVYCAEVGNTYTASLYVALCGTLDHATGPAQQRIGLFSYGSGCASEFFSGVIGPSSQLALARRHLHDALERRRLLTMPEYDRLLQLNQEWFFGIKDKDVDLAPYQAIYESQVEGRGLLVLNRISNFHREYRWS